MLAPSAKRYEDSKELSDDVASDENGIGFVGFAYVRNARAVAGRKRLRTLLRSEGIRGEDRGVSARAPPVPLYAAAGVKPP